MTTITDIINFENDYAEKCMNEEFNKLNNEYEFKIKNNEETLMQKRQKLFKSNNELPILIDKNKKSKAQYPFLVGFYLIIIIVHIYEIYLLFPWFNEDLWTWLSVILTLLVTGFSLYLILVISIGFGIPEPLDFHYKKKENEMNYYKVNREIQTLKSEIKELEKVLINLKFDLPKIENLKIKYTSKDFFNKIPIPNAFEKDILKITNNSNKMSKVERTKFIEKEFFGIIGCNINSDFVQNFLNQLEIVPDIMEFSDCYFYTYKQLGIEINITKNHIIKCIFTYISNSDGYNEYWGYLPYNIKNNDNLIEIKRKLGEPSNSVIDPVGINGAYFDWADKKISIQFNSKNKNIELNSIHDISIYI